MINLLPTDIKQDVMYARRNTILRHWIIGMTIALLVLALIIAGGLLYMKKSVKDYTVQVENSRQALKSQDLEQIQKDLADISTNTKLAVDVLSREILFSKLLRQIGSALPSGTQLNSLAIDKLQGGVTLEATAVDFNAATQIQVNLQDPKNQVFQKADINSINCDKGICTVSIRALFSETNQYTYLTKTGAPKQ